jgi:hypothetical protein
MTLVRTNVADRAAQVGRSLRDSATAFLVPVLPVAVPRRCERRTSLGGALAVFAAPGIILGLWCVIYLAVS